VFEDLVRCQDGVLSRRKAMTAGLTRSQIRAHLNARRWQSMGLGVYATFTGPPPPMSRLWAALLRAGNGAAAGPRTSLWLAGAIEQPPDPLDVVIPMERRVRAEEGLTVIRRKNLADSVHPALAPRRLRIEAAVLDVAADQQRAEAVVDVVLRAVQRRLTTPARLRGQLAARRAHPWRRLLQDLLADAATGVRSPLERRWLHDVERAHGLPAGRLNRPEQDGDRRVYRDADYQRYQLIVEFDGRLAHPDDQRHRDRQRDNRVVVSGRRTLRYGWREVAGDPCGIAAEVAAVLRQACWPGMPHRCSPRCTLVG
jgi:hypothetical protein